MTMTQAFIMWKQGTGRNRLITFRFLAALVLCDVTGVSAFANTPVDDVFLQCDGEVRTRQLAFQLGELEIEEFTPARRVLQIEIKSARRARIMDHTSGDVLFTPRQCKLSDLKIACEHDDDDGIRQLFISRTSGDTIFEGYSESGDKKSNLVVEHYVCVKEAREALF
jgi:hypothetical protein